MGADYCQCWVLGTGQIGRCNHLLLLLIGHCLNRAGHARSELEGMQPSGVPGNAVHPQAGSFPQHILRETAVQPQATDKAGLQHGNFRLPVPLAISTMMVLYACHKAATIYH